MMEPMFFHKPPLLNALSYKAEISLELKKINYKAYFIFGNLLMLYLIKGDYKKNTKKLLKTITKIVLTK